MVDFAQVFPNILNRMIDGEPIAKILKSLGVTHAMDFYSWVDAASNRAQAYARAQMAKAEAFADEIVDISDTEENAHKARNKIQARQWYASKVIPKKYGDRLDVHVEQKVDIGGALIEARKRAVLPNGNLAALTDTQDVDYIAIVDARATDCESAALPPGMPNPFD